jgi:hypothetical protein
MSAHVLPNESALEGTLLGHGSDNAGPEFPGCTMIAVAVIGEQASG